MLCYNGSVAGQQMTFAMVPDPIPLTHDAILVMREDGIQDPTIGCSAIANVQIAPNLFALSNKHV
jgi:hypothetical protein